VMGFVTFFIVSVGRYWSEIQAKIKICAMAESSCRLFSNCNSVICGVVYLPRYVHVGIVASLLLIKQRFEIRVVRSNPVRVYIAVFVYKNSLFLSSLV
jgi:hypothetical protein